MKILAVKGSKEHGEEIIKLFEALGGENTQELSGTNTACIYCMDPETKVIESVLEPDDNKMYDIMDYYPFKDYVNKKVSIHTINMEQGNSDDEVEVLLGDKFEAIVKDGKVVIMKKLYPSTYKECCETLGVNHIGELIYDCDNSLCPYEDDLIEGLEGLRKLTICRDAYWYVADIWAPDYNSDEIRYCIVVENGNIVKKNYSVPSQTHFLEFPNEKMRDIFMDKFTKIIIQCKDFIK